MLQLVVFDLDFCIWQPEMYQIQGPPVLKPLESISSSKRRKNKNDTLLQNLPRRPTSNQKGMIVTDRTGTPITVFDGASYALTEINRMKNEGNEGGRESHSVLQTAVASCTDEPAWARQCMEWLTIEDGSTLKSCFDPNLIEIRYGDKSRHFESLHRKTGIPYENMCFFDDQEYNIMSVASLGVKCVHTPNGMARESWEEIVKMFGL